MRRVAIIGCGQSKHGRRTDVNQAELVAEAVWAAIEDANIGVEDIEAYAVGNMQGFGGICQPDLVFADYIAAGGKPMQRVATGGTVGGSTAHLGYYEVASGMYDVVLAVSWEKHSDSAEPGATTGLLHVAFANLSYMMKIGMDMRSFAIMGLAGAAAGISAYQAAFYMARSGCRIEHFDMVAAKARRNAAKNRYAHLKWPGCTAEDIAKTEMLIWPLRFGHVCPASDGASCVIYASEDAVRRLGIKEVAWVKGVAAYADEEADQGESYQGTAVVDYSDQTGAILSARKAYRRAGIKDPRKEIDVAEIYAPFPHQELMFSERLGFFDDGTAWKALEEGVTEIDGDFPICPSGGVNATNAIGSSGMQRVVEAALQIMGKAEDHQVPKDVKNAVAHAWGGQVQFNTVMVLGDRPKGW
uniref:Thiolase domain-containing protein n=1 Tax=Archaeoglobus fulgidus TaxID=2234 RepID=A0A7C3RB83_ARCFL